MADSNQEKIFQLESRIENMLDKLIESDEELDSNGSHSSLKFSEDISSTEVEKDEGEPFEKEESLNQFFQKDESVKEFPLTPSQKTSFISFNNSSFLSNNIGANQTISSNMNLLYKNYNPFSFNYKYPPQQMNNSNSNFNSSLIDLYNKNYNNNINLACNETLNTTDSFSPNYKNSFNNFIPSTSFINSNYQNFNSSFNNEGNNLMFRRNNKYHNSYYAGDKICFNNKFKSFKNKNDTNVEIEILLIEVNKILNKIEKIDQIFYNKLKGKFEQIIRTHRGSRIFQNYLKNTHTDILHQIFSEIKHKLSELIKDSYANYFCKKLFNCLNQKDRVEFLSIIQNDLNILAIDYIATYPIQGIIEQLGSKAEKNIIYLGIKNYIPIFCYNVYGTHILEKMLSYFEEEFTIEIIDFVYNNFIDLAYHINGICIVKKLLLMTHKKELHQKLKKIIIENALNLIIHQYGNYVIQVIFLFCYDIELEEILNQYKNKYIILSNQKYSSNAIERIIEKNNNNLEFYINEICSENNLIELMINNYGNYVVQKAIKLSSGESRKRLIQDIIKNLSKLEDKKIINKWRTIISTRSSF